MFISNQVVQAISEQTHVCISYYQMSALHID